MDRLKLKKKLITRRANRVRSHIKGTSRRPRLSVHVSHLHITAQIVDDAASKTLAYVTTVGTKASGNLTEKAGWIGTEISKKAKKANVSQVVFDRGAKKYHGRIKALADAARKEGLDF